MAEDDTKRTLIALGAFSQVVGGGGGDIPEDLTVHSLTACSVTATEFAARDMMVDGTIFANGPIFMQECSCAASIQLETSNGDLLANGDLVHVVGTRWLTNGETMRGGRYYYLNTDCSYACLDYSGVKVHCNETAEIWLEVGCRAPENLTLPCTWAWIGTELPSCLSLNHFYDIAARHVKGVGTVANLAFDTPVGTSCVY